MREMNLTLLFIAIFGLLASCTEEPSSTSSIETSSLLTSNSTFNTNGTRLVNMTNSEMTEAFKEFDAIIKMVNDANNLNDPSQELPAIFEQLGVDLTPLTDEYPSIYTQMDYNFVLANDVSEGRLTQAQADEISDLISDIELSNSLSDALDIITVFKNDVTNDSAFSTDDSNGLIGFAINVENALPYVYALQGDGSPGEPPVLELSIGCGLAMVGKGIAFAGLVGGTGGIGLAAAGYMVSCMSLGTSC